MSDNIRAGDVVECLGISNPKSPVHKGDVCRVASCFMQGKALMLVGVTVPSPYIGFAAKCFRKIDAPRTELSERIKACRPIKVGEPA